MSGYTGNPDAEAEHALILSENGINAARSMLTGPVLDECLDCGEQISAQRVAALKLMNMRCMYCITCQTAHDKPNGIKMLDRIL
jgi:RNA polymerase-binding transcription factor DksA